MTSWMSESADESEWASDQSLAACPSQGFQGCWEDIGLCHVIAWMSGPMSGPSMRGLNTHSWATTVMKRENSDAPSQTQTLDANIPTPTHTHCAFSTHLFTRTAWWWWWCWCWGGGGLVTTFRWLMSSVSLSALFCPAPDSVECASPTLLLILMLSLWQ